MGSVWVARHEVLDVDVAVKQMAPELATTELARARFEREAKASAQLKSHHIVRVHDYGVDDGTPFMVMELLEGEDLGERLKHDGPMTLSELAPVVHQICKALEVAHDAGIVHRDLKPSNVFLAREGDDEVVKLVDFGVARETKTNLVEEKTTSGTVIGSPHHMSPEQARGERVDQRSDLWALGVLIYRALTGEKPFAGDAITAVLLEVVTKPIPRATLVNPALPPDIDLFFDTALSRNVTRRFQRARTMARAFTAIAEGRDPRPFLDEAPNSGPGREDATQPSAERVTVPASSPERTDSERADLERAGSSGAASLSSSSMRAERAGELTGSREVAAVTAGVLTPLPSRGSRLWVWALLGAAGLFGAFYLGRAGSDATPPEVAASAVASAPPMASAAATPTEPSGTAPIASTSQPPLPSASSVAAPTPPPANRPLPLPAGPQNPTAPKMPPPPPPGPPPQPKIDPFTGLPTSP